VLLRGVCSFLSCMYRVSGPDLTTLYILLVTVNESTKFYDFIFGTCESDGVFFSFFVNSCSPEGATKLGTLFA